MKSMDQTSLTDCGTAKGSRDKATARSAGLELDRCVDDGIQYLNKGDLVSAEAKFLQALAIDPNNANANSLMGVIALSSGIDQIAEEYFRKAVSLNPNIASYHFNLSLALLQSEQYHEAIPPLRQSLDLDPNFAPAWNSLGQALLRIEEYEAAAEALRKSIAIQEDFGEPWVNLCGALQELGNFHDAQVAGKRGCELLPDSPHAHYNLARALDRDLQWDDAISSYLKSLELDPEYTESYVNYSHCLAKNDRAAEGEKIARKAIELDPNSDEAHNNLGISLMDLGRYPEAITSYLHSIKLNPEPPNPHNNLSHIYLLSEEFVSGWREYEYGFAAGERGIQTITPAPVWNGEPLEGKTIHVYAEQGIGEQIMFATMLEDLRSANASIIYECEERLVPIFKRSFPEISTVPKLPETDPLLLSSDVDFRIAAGSLGQWFRPTTDSFHPCKKMLQADPDLVRIYRDRYHQLGDGIVVGISWKSNSSNHAKKKNFPIELWGPILTTPNCHFVSLQYGDVDEDIDYAAREFGTNIFVDPEVSAINSLEQSMAQAFSVDLVISISNATVHLSGAGGIPTWLLLGENPLWHWFLEREDCLWYDSIRIFRKHFDDDQSEPIKSVALALQKHAQHQG